MRCPKCHTETPPAALNCPGCNLPTPRGKTASLNEKKKGAKKTSGVGFKDKYRDSSKPVGWRVLLPTGGRWVRWVIILAVVAIGGYGSYWYVYSSAASSQGDPKTALTAMSQLRRLPSKQPGQTIDEAINAELKKSKESGELVSYQGWTVKANGGSSFLVSFSFEEKTGKKSADWLVNLTNNTFVPQSELATAVHK